MLAAGKSIAKATAAAPSHAEFALRDITGLLVLYALWESCANTPFYAFFFLASLVFSYCEAAHASTRLCGGFSLRATRKGRRSGRRLICGQPYSCPVGARACRLAPAGIKLLAISTLIASDAWTGVPR
jgi:hypothetical protein